MLMGVAKRPKLYGHKQVIGNETTIRFIYTNIYYRKMHAKVKFNGTLVLAQTNKYEHIYMKMKKNGAKLSFIHTDGQYQLPLNETNAVQGKGITLCDTFKTILVSFYFL